MAYCSFSSNYFNPRSLTGATFLILFLIAICLISIHAPLRERLQAVLCNITSRLFQSTLPYGSDRSNPVWYDIYKHFNPRSLTGATILTSKSRGTINNFNPRSLTGATRSARKDFEAPADFNPRSLTGATRSYRAANDYKGISIHAPLRERLFGF